MLSGRPSLPDPPEDKPKSVTEAITLQSNRDGPSPGAEKSVLGGPSARVCKSRGLGSGIASKWDFSRARHSSHLFVRLRFEIEESLVVKAIEQVAVPGDVVAKAPLDCVGGIVSE